MAIPRPFPNETDAYRAARKKLLAAEEELRTQIERVAQLRRELPLGGEPPEDYVFHRGSGAQFRLSEMFGKHDTLFVYNFMYGPKMDEPCSLCTSILDSLNGAAPHASQRVAMAVVAKSPYERIKAFADTRGWNNLRLYSSEMNSFQADYLSESEEQFPFPMAHVFVRDDGKVRHFWSSEMFYSQYGDLDTRHVDLLWPLWNLFDLTPQGRGKDWYPQLSYDE